MVKGTEINKTIDTAIYMIALIFVAVSIPLSRFTMSVSQFFLLFVWLINGLSYDKIYETYQNQGLSKSLGDVFRYFWKNFVGKIKIFLHNPVAILLVSFYLLHVVGLLYTSDFNYALKDLRVKLPLLIFPIVFCSMSRLTEKQLHIVLLFYVLAVIVGTIFSFNRFLEKDFNDIRNISRFIHSIRFSLSIVFAFFILGYFLFQKNTSWIFRIGAFLGMSWLFSHLIILESLIGFLIIVLVIIILIVYFLFTIKKNIYYRIALTALLILVPFVVVYYISHTVKEMATPEKVNFATLDKQTKLGNPYTHDTLRFKVEDGRYIGLYISRNELAKAWNERSVFDFYGLDQKNQKIEATIVRYLNSKNLRKDAEGVSQLSEQDIKNIEEGFANYKYLSSPGLRVRISKVLMGYNEFTRYNNPNGSSVMQRIEYIKASIYLIKKNPVFGIGTGDIPDAFVTVYDEMNSKLKAPFRLRSHNQYLSVTIVFGIVGLIWFLLMLLYPYLSSKKYRTYFYSVFLLIILISMLSEDTIESQDGATLYAYFNALFLFIAPYFLSKDGNNEYNP